MNDLSASWRKRPSQPGSAGGDWVDVLRLAGGRLAVSMGDAAGHDGQAAALALLLSRLLRDRLQLGTDPGQALAGALAEIADLGDMGEMYATAFVAIAEADGTVTYANAGHPAPVVLNGEPSREADGPAPGRLLGPTGPLLSDLFAGTTIWSNRTLRLGPGESLLLYTDGLAEARNAAGAEFGLARLVTAGSRRNAGRGRTDGADVLDRLFTEVATFTRRAADDRSALVLSRPDDDGGDSRARGRSRGAAISAGVRASAGSALAG
ncbi:PP2C family protein-serine/threonine phosphatase [Parafrankia sp. EUN1f]|uniref:PP2C family protein-serine/threonine phosphatase n=1 Tax=Parafrankia sp. EUN1f TaxID=102897 RepID=UPI0001C468D0|nr:PP2C family protein-serine/threonine phosphatase [Parafrankia sp. EUN1f]EFC80416.1 protein serine/threonine phosphatase [Parafrankia sp. EUN1f]